MRNAGWTDDGPFPAGTWETSVAYQQVKDQGINLAPYFPGQLAIFMN